MPSVLAAWLLLGCAVLEAVESGAAPAVLVSAAGVEAAAEPWDGETGSQADVLSLETALLAEMDRRGVPAARLGAAPRARLRTMLERAAREAPLRFHYFARLSPRFAPDVFTALFILLKDRPEQLGGFVAAQVRFRPKPALAAGTKAGAASNAAPAPSEFALEEMALQYERYLRRRVTYELQVECCVPAGDYGLIFDGGRLRR